MSDKVAKALKALLVGAVAIGLYELTKLVARKVKEKKEDDDGEE
jgi:hypothetical protein